MGRGRQKAKQTKVARELKYYSPESDFTALVQELRGESHSRSRSTSRSRNSDDFDDPDYIDDDIIAKYADWSPEDDEDDDDDEDDVA